MEQIVQEKRIDLLGVAKAQKGILWSILLYLLSILGFVLSPEIFTRVALLFPLLTLVQIYFTIRLRIAFNGSIAIIVLWTIGMLIPILSFILLLLLNSKATNVLKKNGFRVGLMGADVDQVRAGSLSSVSQ